LKINGSFKTVLQRYLVYPVSLIRHALLRSNVPLYSFSSEDGHQVLPKRQLLIKFALQRRLSVVPPVRVGFFLLTDRQKPQGTTWPK